MIDKVSAEADAPQCVADNFKGLQPNKRTQTHEEDEGRRGKGRDRAGGRGIMTDELVAGER